MKLVKLTMKQENQVKSHTLTEQEFRNSLVDGAESGSLGQDCPFSPEVSKVAPLEFLVSEILKNTEVDRQREFDKTGYMPNIEIIDDLPVGLEAC